MFSNLASISELDDALITDIAQHLVELENEFKSNFSEISEHNPSLAKSPFRFRIVKVADKSQDQ